MASRLAHSVDAAPRNLITGLAALWLAHLGGMIAGAAPGAQVVDVPPTAPQEVSVAIDVRGEKLLLDLERLSRRAPSFKVLVQDGGGLQAIEAPVERTYRGRVRGQSGSAVGATLHQGRLTAVARLADGTLWFVQPSAESGLHEVTALDELPAGPWLCGAESTFVPARRGDAPGGAASGGAGSGGAASGGMVVSTLAFDSDVEFYQLHGSSVASTVNDIETIMAMVTAIYEAEVGISCEIGTVIVRTVEPDPYQATNHIQLLGQFSAHWNANHQGVVRDAAHLMTGRDLDGGYVGAAALGVICSSPSAAYGLSQSLFTTNFGLRFALTAHEIGHNWGAGHCAAECDGSPGDPDCAIMCPCIGGCTGNLAAFGASATSQIVAHRDAVTCIGGAGECPADLDGNGVINVQDMVSLVLGWGGSTADLTGDGVVDVQDLVALVLAWGDCP